MDVNCRPHQGGISLSGLASYVSHRQQCVMIHDHNLYIIINDLFQTSCQSFSLLMIQISFFRHNDLAAIFNVELSRVSSWFNANKLTVHPVKFKFIIFHPRRKQINVSDINISLNNSPITRVQRDK